MDAFKVIKKYYPDYHDFGVVWITKHLREILRDRGEYDSYGPCSDNSTFLFNFFTKKGLGAIWDHPRKVDLQPDPWGREKYGIVLQPYGHAKKYKDKFFEVAEEFGLKVAYSPTSHYRENCMSFCIYDVFNVPSAEEINSKKFDEYGKDYKRIPINVFFFGYPIIINAFKYSDIETVGDLVNLTKKEVLSVDRIGKVSFKQIQSKLWEMGFDFRKPTE
jgi:hypothetical protein